MPLLEANRGEDVEQASSGLPFRPRLVGGVDLAAELELGLAESEAGDAETARDVLEIGRGRVWPRGMGASCQPGAALQYREFS